jgi:serine/threonine protein kinase
MATLSIVESVDAFVETIEKSGLLSADAMAKVRELAAKSDNPKALARPLVKEGVLTNWQANQLLYGFHKLVIGKYKLLSQLGAGEMGRVYLAEHVQMARRHCLKVLSRRHTIKPDVLKRFLDEAQRVCALEHRNLSHVYDVNQSADQYYLVMEYVEGQDLQSLVAKAGKLPVAETLEYARQTAEGLAHAHEQGVVHGDLKPSNLVLEEGGTIKILEIGQARLAEGPQGPIDKDETAETTSLAAAIHHAPEQRGQTRTIDQRSDVYSLGSVLVCLLTGKAAPDAATAETQLKQVAKLPDSLLKLCLQMMAEDPSERPANMQAVLSDLSAVERERSLPPIPAGKSADSKPAAEARPPAKAKKPPVAKAIAEPGALPVAKSLDAPPVAVEPAEAEAEAEESSPFAGFAIQTKGRVGARKPPVKSPAGDAPAVAVSASGASTDSATAKKSNLPLILGGSIGGGVLALAGICLIVYLVFFRDGGTPTEVAQAPKGASAAAAVESEAEGSPTESNPGESNPAAETNPTAEANPTPSAPTATKAPEPTAAPAANGTAKATPEPAKPADPPMPAPTPEPAPTETKPADPPMPAPTPEPAPAPTPPPAAPKPMAPVGNPLEGFAKAVSLPKLGSAMSDLPPEALAPKALGPCKVDAGILVIARLKGGEFAARGGRQKFEMVAANGGTALQDWEVNLNGPEGKILVAKLGVKEGNIAFQWTPEGAKEANAPYLGNCALELIAGTGNHVVALREPVVGPPLDIELEKQGTAKWTVDHLPDPKNIHFEVTKLNGIPRQKYDPENVMKGVGEDVTVWTGPNDDVMPLGIRLTSAVSGKNLQVTSVPWLRFEGMKKAEKYSKKVLATGKAGAAQRLSALTQQREALPKGEQTDAQRNLLSQQIEALNKGASQVEAITGFIDSLKGTGKMHFRIYYAAEEGAQVDLLVTNTEPAAPAADAPAEAPADAKK